MGDQAAANDHLVQRLRTSLVVFGVKARSAPVLASEPANHRGRHPVNFYALRTAAPA
jgi:hypothetical protein